VSNARRAKHTEFVISLMLIDALVTVATPYYLSMRARALDGTAQTILAQAAFAANVVYTDRGSYAGMTLGILQTVDPAVSPAVDVVTVTPSTYCLRGASGERVWYVGSASGEPTRSPCV
jgi:hypothetical protein